MGAFANGNYRIVREDQWLGSPPLLANGDRLSISGLQPHSTGHSAVDLGIVSGQLAGYGGSLKLRTGSSRAVGGIGPAAGAPGIHYQIAAEVIGIAKARSLRLVLIRVTDLGLTTNDEEGGGEWEGDEEP